MKPIYQVDAFVTGKPFSGNPAGVCFLTKEADEGWMQGVAMEMNLSETAFLVPRGNEFDLRWFTPSVEVALCGHATLGSAHILWESGRLAQDAQARFHTKSGLLTADKKGDLIEMDFPAKVAEPAAPSREIDILLKALGVKPAHIARNQFDYLIEVSSENEVRSCAPDQGLLRTIPVRGVIVTSRGTTPGFDFISRFFAPGSGVDEDPVTGSAHTALGPYWKAKLGKDPLAAYQASKRGGIVHVRVAGDRVKLAGRAVTTIRGELL